QGVQHVSNAVESPQTSRGNTKHGVSTLESLRKAGKIDKRTSPFRAIKKIEQEITARHTESRKRWHATISPGCSTTASVSAIIGSVSGASSAKAGSILPWIFVFVSARLQIGTMSNTRPSCAVIDRWTWRAGFSGNSCNPKRTSHEVTRWECWSSKNHEREKTKSIDRQRDRPIKRPCDYGVINCR